MTDREEFEKCHNNMISEGLEVNPLEIIVIKKYFDFAWQEATTRQQKIIDELKANNFAMSAMVCKHPDKRTLDENYDSIKDYCDMLKAENPDAPCPACKCAKYGFTDDGWEVCNFCKGKGTVSTVKALQYENALLISIAPEMSEEIETLQKLIKNISKAYYKGGDAMHYAISEAKNYMEGGH